jgi:quercetin dioxygenase-like cupin family protein
MIHAGQTVEIPVTGEVLTFLRTARETNGESVLVEVTVRPGGFVAAAHVHSFQSERFEVLEGTLGIKLAGKEMIARAGDVVVIEAGQAHKFWNAGEGPARFVTDVRPALDYARLIETMFGLAADGKTNRKGMPNPLRLAVIARAHFDVVRLPFPPVWLQRLGLALGAPLGRLAGYSATYEPTGGRTAIAGARSR